MLDFSTVAQAYKQACERVKELLKTSSFKIVWIMKEVGLGRAAFYARLNAANWEPQHLETFGRIFAQEPKKEAGNTISAN